MPAPLPENESERLQALRSYAILDTLAETAYDDLTQLAAYVCAAPIALVSLVDESRQWFKSRVGLEAPETHRDLAFCAHAILVPEDLFEVQDARLDPRFKHNALVTGEPKIRFYAGMPLVADGHALGTLCVIDRVPRTLNEGQKSALQALGRQAATLIEARRALLLLEGAQAGLVKANEQHSRAEARYRDSIDASPSMLLVVASDGRISQVTASLAALAGHERAALVGQPALCLVPERLREEFSASYATFFKSPAPTPARTDRYSILLCSDGSELPVETTLNPITTSEGLFAIVTVVNVAARVRAEALLRDSEERFRDLFENASDLIQAVDPSGRFLYVNRSWREALGYSADEAKTMSFQDVIHPGSRAHCASLFERVMLRQEIGRVDAAFVTRGGQRIEVEGHISLRLREGRPESTRAIFRDVTARNRQMVELAQARQRAEAADQTKSAFLAAMSHELRTPLNSIIGFTGIIRAGMAGPLTAEQAKQLGMVHASAQHLLALINDVLDLSKIEAGELRIEHTPFDLLASITKVVALVTPLAQKKGLALRTEPPSAFKPMLGDARRVEQVLLNLLSNAIKFTEKGEVLLSMAPGKQTVQLNVKDSGMGIKTQDMARLFQPFKQIDDGLARNHDGTGLGLVISRRLARLMGGDIEVQSEWGKGSTFTFTLAREARAAGETQ